MGEKEYRPVNNRLIIYGTNGEKIDQFEGNIFVYYDDYKESGFIHFKDNEGKHHRVHGLGVVVEEI